MFSTMEFFADSYLYGVSEEIELGCPSGNLGQRFYLHKCKMATDRYRSFLILETLVSTSSVIPRLRVVWFVEFSFSVGF